MTSVKNRLENSNGWQRLWLVCTVTAYIYFCVFMPFIEVEKNSSFRYETLFKIEAEMKKPECASYMNLPFNQLVEPSIEKIEEGCIYIYSHRRYSHTKQPITRQSVGDDFTSTHRQNLLEWFVLGLLFSTFLSAFAYALGALVVWVTKGFRKKKL